MPATGSRSSFRATNRVMRRECGPRIDSSPASVIPAQRAGISPAGAATERNEIPAQRAGMTEVATHKSRQPLSREALAYDRDFEQAGFVALLRGQPH